MLYPLSYEGGDWQKLWRKLALRPFDRLSPVQAVLDGGFGLRSMILRQEIAGRGECLASRGPRGQLVSLDRV